MPHGKREGRGWMAKYNLEEEGRGQTEQPKLHLGLKFVDKNAYNIMT